MNQLAFNLDQALEARDEGIRQVADNNQFFLRVAREVARRLARMNGGEVTCDDVRKACPFDPLHPNAWGAVFRDKGFEFTGKLQKSALVQGHGNLQRVWRLAE